MINMINNKYEEERSLKGSLTPIIRPTTKASSNEKPKVFSGKLKEGVVGTKNSAFSSFKSPSFSSDSNISYKYQNSSISKVESKNEMDREISIEETYCEQMPLMYSIPPFMNAIPYPYVDMTAFARMNTYRTTNYCLPALPHPSLDVESSINSSNQHYKNTDYTNRPKFKKLSSDKVYRKDVRAYDSYHGAYDSYPQTSVIKKKRKKKDPRAPKPPLSSYLFFVSEQRIKMSQMEEYEKHTFTEVARIIGKKWKSLTPTERYGYEEKAKIDKERYLKEKKQFLELQERSHREYQSKKSNSFNNNRNNKKRRC